MFITVTNCSLQHRVKRVRVEIICTGTPEDSGMAGAFIPLYFQKGSNGGAVAFSS